MEQTQDKPYKKLIPYVKFLLEQGNVFSKGIPGFNPNSDGFYQDKDGWKCDFKYPINFSLIPNHFSPTQDIILNKDSQSIFDNSSWSEIRGEK